eukprot:Phypoly_transcript_08720.p1 GENE.Phypoly_transcript_08720~~Phypoly_transcript_08720.p1  ORF type:complete len:297 (+),score=82.35 Phypoly_transcript_08720:55-945(+)
MNLPESVLSAQLDTYNFLQSVYCMDGEFTPAAYAESTLLLLQEPSIHSTLPPLLSFDLSITLDPSHSFSLHVALPLQVQQGTKPQIHLRRPTWMNNKMHSELVAKMKKEKVAKGDEEEGGAEIVMRVVDFLRENAISYVQASQEQEKGKKDEKEEKIDEKVVRAWFYFPSLSTKEKRKDLVDYALGYKITGFVVAGKPGMMCLEGTSTNISAYMSDIKNISWADIPSNNKKVSERYREEDGVERVFKNMQEVTDSVFQAGMRGTRGNRGDMKELKGYLDQFGLGDRMEKVLSANWE